MGVSRSGCGEMLIFPFSFHLLLVSTCTPPHSHTSCFGKYKMVCYANVASAKHKLRSLSARHPSLVYNPVSMLYYCGVQGPHIQCLDQTNMVESDVECCAGNEESFVR